MRFKPRRTIRHTLNKRRWRRERSLRGFSERDAWGFDYHLAEVIAGGTAWLRDHMHGCPGELAEGPGGVDEGCEKWRQILDEISSGFAAYVVAEENFERPPASFERAQKLLVEWWGALWD